jgi:hypothetical protein
VVLLARHPHRSTLAAAALAAALPLLVIGGPLAAPAAAATTTTAWQNGAFSENVGGIVSRSDVVLGKPNTVDSQSMPLGNGSLGVAAWAANGFTAQLNRSDTQPYRLSPGQIQIPGLEAMTSASNFSGYLDLYNGVLHESGGGITMNAWVPEGKDEMIVDVTGANPSAQQTATLNLWSGRSPSATASGAYGSLAQTWVDNAQSGNSGQTFGAMATITAGGQNVTASVVNSTEVQVAFTPNSNGSYRVVVAAPQWTGGNPATTASSLIGSDATTASSTLLATQSAWWNNYWANTGLIEMYSADGTAQYMENLRTIYLYTEAASMKAGAYPGSQAGVADMFAFDEDQQDWYPAGYWLWNLRGQIAANLSSGDYALNIPIFQMYLNDLPAIESWTSAQMGGLPGACIPETMRFNGNGYYNGGSNTQNASCATASSPSYNAENITSGPELAMWIWQQYQDTGSLSFLQTYYPILEQVATFQLAYQKVGSDGYLHATANAHETQWAVTDPAIDLAADQALFPAVASAATLLNTDASLVSQLKTAENEIEPYPRASQSNLTTLLNAQPTSPSAVASIDAQGTDVIADSYQPSATLHNGENIGLEAVWPWNDITDSTTVNGDNLTALADRTYTSRPNVGGSDWSMDAIDAARLDMSSAVASDLTSITEDYQAYPDGMGQLASSSPGDEPYIEQSSEVATAVDEAFATDYDGTLRIAPAWPSGWDGQGTVYIQGNSKVDVQVEGGTIATVAIQAGTTETMSVRNPWSGQQVEVVNGSTGATVVSGTTAATLSVPVVAGSSYLVELVSAPTTSLPFAQLTGTQATTDKHLGNEQIGLDGAAAAYSNLAASFNNVGITADNNTTSGNFDGGGASFSETALTNAGAGPGASVTSGGITYTMPSAAAGANDNTVAEGQTIDAGGSGSSLGFLLSGSYGPASGSGTITYTDGSNSSYSLTAPDWFSTTAPSGGTVAVSSAYQNRQGNTTYAGTGDIFAETVPLTAGKTVASVTLPSGGALTSGTAAIHVFALGFPASSEAPYGGTPAAVPGTIQAANYDTGGQGVAYNVTSTNGTGNSYRSDGVDLEATSNSGGGDDLGWTATGQWFKYTVNVATAGTYNVSLQLASPSGVTDALHIANAAGTNLSGNIAAPNTGGWQTWAAATATVTLPAGVQTLTIDQDNGGWNIYNLSLKSASTGSGISTSAWYEVVNANSGLCVGAAGAGTANGTAVQQSACTGATSQLWQFSTAATGYYEVLNDNAQSEGESWNITGGVSATASGDLLQTWNYGGPGNTNALFAANAQSSGAYTLTADNSGLCVDVPNASTASGVQLQQYTCNGTTAQQFTLTQS